MYVENSRKCACYSHPLGWSHSLAFLCWTKGFSTCNCNTCSHWVFDVLLWNCNWLTQCPFDFSSVYTHAHFDMCVCCAAIQTRYTRPPSDHWFGMNVVSRPLLADWLDLLHTFWHSTHSTSFPLSNIPMPSNISLEPQGRSRLPALLLQIPICESVHPGEQLGFHWLLANAFEWKVMEHCHSCEDTAKVSADFCRTSFSLRQSQKQTDSTPKAQMKKKW